MGFDAQLRLSSDMGKYASQILGQWSQRGNVLQNTIPNRALRCAREAPE
jgi:hypothetical protein